MKLKNFDLLGYRVMGWLADKKELLKTTKNPKQRKELQQEIAELEREIKGPPPKQGKLPLRGYTKKPK